MSKSTKLLDLGLIKNTERAVKVFTTLKRRLNALGFETPKCYDPKRRGGILTLAINNKLLPDPYQIGKIIETTDPVFSSKKDKYIDYAVSKILTMFNNNINRSELAEIKLIFIDKFRKEIMINIKVAGGVRFYISGFHLFHLGFSGRSPEADQAIVCLAAYKSEITNKVYIQELYEQTKNPFLEWNLFGALLSEM